MKVDCMPIVILGNQMKRSCAKLYPWCTRAHRWSGRVMVLARLKHDLKADIRWNVDWAATTLRLVRVPNFAQTGKRDVLGLCLDRTNARAPGGHEGLLIGLFTVRRRDFEMYRTKIQPFRAVTSPRIV